MRAGYKVGDVVVIPRLAPLSRWRRFCDRLLRRSEVQADTYVITEASAPQGERIALETMRRYGAAGRKARRFARGSVRIWSGEHRVYWRPNRAGYTLDRSEAGVYEFHDAVDRTAHCGPEKKIYYERDL